MLAAVILVVPVAIEFPALVVKVNVKSLVALTWGGPVIYTKTINV
jgi:hypothetical protein